MSFEIIEKGLPEELESQLVEGEKTYYFSYITYSGGCLSLSSKEDYWIALTNKRALYRAKILENQTTVEKEGVLPLEKVSFIEVTKATKSGCSSSESFEIRLSTSGGSVNIPVPTKEKGDEIKTKFLHITELMHAKSKNHNERK